MRPGDSFDLALESRPGAGYRWAYASDRPDVVAVEAVLATAPDPERRERFRLVARAPGTASVAFELRRPFDAARPALATRTLRIVVR